LKKNDRFKKLFALRRAEKSSAEKCKRCCAPGEELMLLDVDFPGGSSCSRRRQPDFHLRRSRQIE